ncbi:UDP-N-acetylglucosamine 2-epimerase (hydrolyzing) [Parabacteroides acidifaciens]|uniref:UDP-N-acetylglucosamine 2-epimerase (Hydrolyzing) n=1 Tax=Parabacteroides acidifaciens TaxID=2290935 RepID=A0A3D8HEH6_9BACT|nr:UDP-N-acetylglucosamine 2-epimerase [Parabacteroides acidifaciens]MBC8601964.1 UDP-N-acetylglucosamine 2-epimerase (hydrolyzing) [Parabacteroides acidifaciens]RDU49301.1 UDP-N-acetylglucosamine 2-epimerase (hydrolyzing) [Parabacteroides acidifaciens]
MRKICVITGSRAEYGLLSGLMKQIDESEDLKLQVIATNMHLSPEFGLTYKEIEKDGFVIDKRVEMLLSSDTSSATAKSVGLGMIGFADAYEDLRPDLIVVLGDRYEILAAVSAALFFKIPVAHLHGGEITEGAYDDAIRHAITKMSHLHFTSTEEYRKRVIQLGESPDRVFNVGAIGVENIKKGSFLSKEELENSLGFKLGDKSLLVTFHPVTLETCTAREQCDNLLEVLARHPEYRILFTLPNSDTDGRVIIDCIKDFVAKNEDRAIAFKSLGKLRYLSALKYVSAAIGNSSSGILEVSSFGIPTLDIGDRQKGRIAAKSVVHCGTSTEEIEQGFRLIFSETIQSASKLRSNPYEKEGTTDMIVSQLKTYPLENLIQKSFYNL